MSLYQPLEVIETKTRINGRQWWVRDEEEGHLWNLVEYVGRPGRMTCGCPDGQAHAETPDVEHPCPHLRAVVDAVVATQRAAGPPLGVLKPSVFVD